MIPERWNSLYLYASIYEDKGQETGEMYFYYFPKGLFKKNPVNVYEIPKKFNIEEKSYMRLASELYKLIKELRHRCMVLDKTNWSNITISIENVDFLVEYNSDDLKRSIYSSDDRRKIWQYKYLEYPLDRFKKSERQMIENYIQEEEQGLHGVTIYSETFYQEHAHNNIQYDITEEVERYITDDELVVIKKEEKELNKIRKPFSKKKEKKIQRQKEKGRKNKTQDVGMNDVPEVEFNKAIKEENLRSLKYYMKDRKNLRENPYDMEMLKNKETKKEEEDERPKFKNQILKNIKL